MIIFNPRQSDCAGRARKNENAGTFNFTSQIARSICIVAVTKCEKSDATIFTSRCSRTAVGYRSYRVYALPLIFIRLSRLADSLPTNRRNPARRSRNVREPSGKKDGEMSRSLPHNFSAIADNGQSNAAEFPHEPLARQLATWRATIRQRQFQSPRNRQYNIQRTIPQDGSSRL